MVKKFLVLLSSLLMCFSFQAKADEGMWMLNIIGKRYEQMKAMGLELSPEQIYSINQSSLKDAIVNFGGFCTGEIISDKGLLLTNHHCGYERIQMHSTTEKNYLKDGFWAKSLAAELPNSGLFVTFLVKIEDVTESLINLKDEALGTKMAELENEAIGDSHYTAEIKDFFAGNKYYLFTYETYTDVRLVGAPPSSVGKFGGDTDNWMWPRHTGDFALFRVYAGKDGKPAEYSKDNVPLKPKHFLPVSLDGVEENDFAMILGYPGSTERYLPTEGVKLLLEETNPARIKLREKRLAIMKAEMEKDAKIDLMYSPKYFQISNYYKYFIGQNRGIKNLNVIAEKRQEEADFVTWVNTSEQNQKEYGGVIQGFSEIYQSYKDVNLPYVYLNEGAFASDIMLLAYHMAPMYAALKSGMKKEQMQGVLDDMKVKAEEHFADYYAPIDQKILAAMLKSYKEDIASTYHPTIIQDINKKYKGNFDKYADYVFKKSFLTTKEKTLAFIENPDLKVIENDPAFEAMLSVLGTFRSTAGAKLGEIYGKLDSLNFLYLKGKQMMFPDSTFYPDANFTQRLTYGKVSGYWAQDGVYYNYYTTLKGVIEKENPLSEEFVVEPGIKELYEKKEYGQYANKDGELPVCFISNNDITGGNSGSPVINGKGHLIGTAFDGNWEAMSGDIEFSPKLQRTIITDIRYVLFIIDKYADAKHLIDEMETIKTK
jgi:hypothetical protein